MFPKQSNIPKKGFGSTLSFNNAVGFSFPLREDYKIHPKPSPTAGSKTMSPPTYKIYQKEGFHNQDQRISELMRDIGETKEALKQSKREILRELPVFQSLLKQEIQTLMLYFIDHLKNNQADYGRELQISIDILRSQINEKEIVNQNLLEVNKTLAQKNEALSKLLFNTTDKLNKAQSREQSLDDNRDHSMGYTKKFSEKLLHESKSISKHIRKPQDLTAYSSARIKSTIKPPKEIPKLSSARLNSKSRLVESQRTLATESDRADRFSSNDNLESPFGRRLNLQTGEASFVYMETEDAETNMMKSSIEQLIEDSQNYRKIALEENQKYLEAVQALDEAAKEKMTFLETKEKYEKFLEENEELLQNSQKILKQLTTMVNEKQFRAFSNNEEESLSSQDEIEKLKKLNIDFEENYLKVTQSLKKKIELITLEKEQVEKLLDNTRVDLEVAIKNHKKAVQTISSLTSDLGKADNQLDNSQSNNIQALQAELERTRQELENYANKENSINVEANDNEKDFLKKEIEQLTKELEDTQSKLKAFEENYSGQFEVINDIHSKIEALCDKFNQLRNTEDKEYTPSTFVSKERESVESVSELFTKLDGLEKTLHWYLEERKRLIDENNKLQTRLHEVKVEGDSLIDEKKPSLLNQEETIKTSNDELGLKIEEYEAKLEQLNIELNKAIQSKCEMENEVKSLQKVEGDLENEIKDYKAQFSNVEAKMLELDAGNLNLQETNKLLEENISIVSKEKQELFKKVKECNDTIEELNSTIEKLQLTVDETQRNYEEAQEKFANKTVNTNETQEEINNLQLKIEELEKNYVELKNEKEILEKLSKIDRERTEELEKYIEDLKIEHETKIQEYEHIMTEYLNNNQNQQDSKEQMFEKYEKLQKVCDQFELQCERLTREKEELEMDLRICQNENEDLQKNLEKMALKYNIEQSEELNSEEDPDII